VRAVPALTDEQWFDVAVVALQVVAGGIVTLLAVWIGAALALRGQRRAAAEQRETEALYEIMEAFYATFRRLCEVQPDLSNLRDVFQLAMQDFTRQLFVVVHVRDSDLRRHIRMCGAALMDFFLASNSGEHSKETVIRQLDIVAAYVQEVGDACRQKLSGMRVMLPGPPAVLDQSQLDVATVEGPLLPRRRRWRRRRNAG
jgi:hypothetical protein